MNWTDDICQRTIDEMTGAPGITYERMAQSLSDRVGEIITYEQLRSALRRYKNRSGKQQLYEAPIQSWFPVGVYNDDIEGEDEAEDLESFPEPVRIAEQEVLTLPDANVLVLGDIHAPYHSTDMLERAVRITKRWFPHIKHCAVIGDLFDFSAISNHLNNQPITSTEVDMRAGGKIAKKLRREFELWIGPGNHDERLSKKLNSEFSMESLLCGALGNTDPGLHITDLDYFYIGDDIIAGHPNLYSSKPAGVAAKVALMQRKNIITGHSHKVGLTVSDDGIHWVVDNGHCADDALFYYVRRRLSTFGKMGAGFTIVSNGKPFVFGEAITDWNHWLD